MPALATRIGEFAARFSAADLTPFEAHEARRALLDTLACTLGGWREDAAVAALRYARKVSGPGVASLWGSAEKLGLEQAAFVNAVAGHVLDYDDVATAVRGHPSVGLLPALVALAEAEGLGMDAVAAAYVAGFEVAGRIGLAMGDEHYARGWHATASIGVLGATVACASLLRLPAAHITHAIGLAVAQAAGTRENFGTDAKSFQAGHANRAALQSVLLAREGFTAAPEVLEGPRGYLSLYGNGEDLVAGFADLGATPRLLEQSRLEVKKYPMCYATHRTLDGLLDLKREAKIALADVAEVAVVANARAFAPLLHDRPQTGLEGKFSLQYAVAAALADGSVTLASFEDGAVQRPAVQEFLAQVSKQERAGPLNPRYAEISVKLKDGRELTRRVDALRGGPTLPLSDAELTTKLADCLRHGGSGVDAPALAARILAPGNTPLAEILRAAAPPRAQAAE